MSFRCVVVTPEQQTLDETITQAIIPVHDGLIGILTDRALARQARRRPITPRPRRRTKPHLFHRRRHRPDEEQQPDDPHQRSDVAADINLEAARAEYAEAEARKPTDQKTIEDRNHQMARGRAKQAMAGKKG